MQGDTATIIHNYHEALYRKDGIHTYKDKDGQFEAEIKEVLPNGTLRILRKDGNIKEYMFKEIEFILP